MHACDGAAWVDDLCARLGAARQPLLGQWELTCRCNLQCVMCYTDPFNTPERVRRELPTADIIRILHELAEAGCLQLCLTGGEPLARPDFLEIYTTAKQLGLLVVVFTNGTFVTERIADHWAQQPPHRIEISLYGLTRETYERTTQRPGSYDACLRGIALVRARGLPLTLKTPAMTINQQEILAMRAWAQSQGLHYQFGETMRPRLDGALDTTQWQLPDDALQALEQSAGTAWDEHVRVAEQPRRCGAARFKFHIDAYGQLQLCSQNRDGSYDLRHGSFREGFYEALPRFACRHKTGVQLMTGTLTHA